MGKTMAKGNVIWGEQHSVSLASFSDSNMVDLATVIKAKIGPQEMIQQGAAWKVINAAKRNPKMKDAYVKAGVIGSDLVLRCKEKRFFGDIEADAILVPNYRRKVEAWKVAQMEAQVADVQRQVHEREEAERQEAERQEVARRKAQSQRLKTLMTTPDAEGDTPRDKILRATQKAKKLGIGDFAQKKLERQGLTPMHEVYHAEVLDHQKNRYGRYLGGLRKIWETHASTTSSLSQWLDDVEANKNVPGLAEARAQLFQNRQGKLEKVVQNAGTTGGLVTYLDDEGRKPYVAAVRNGRMSGSKIGASGEVIFVIGPDNKIYAGSKARAERGQTGAFNHSSFFSGGPVKAAGTLHLRGGQIVAISDESGHYAPTESMILQSVRKFATGSRDWLKVVQVTVNKKTTTGMAFMGIKDEPPKAPKSPKSPSPSQAPEATTALGQAKLLVLRSSKAYHGSLDRSGAEALLKGKPGAWLLRQSKGKIVLSYHDEDAGQLVHSLIETEEHYQQYTAYKRSHARTMVTA